MTQTHQHGHGHGHGAHEDAAQAPAAFWDDLYSQREQMWSGRVNATLADVVGTLTPGRALDLGCGEGGDAIWLAQNGWTTTGVDISATAVRRAQQAATAAGLDESRVRFVVADLADADALDDAYDLVTASFFHSPVALDRAAVLRRAAHLLAPGGHLLLVTHAAAPPWADPEQVAHHTFLTPAQEVAELGFGTDGWDVVLAETRTRTGTSPDGVTGTLDDGVVLVRRR